MDGLPVMMNLSGRRCLVVGGGVVGSRRAASLVEAGALVCWVTGGEAVQAPPGGAHVASRRFEPADVDGALLVVAATDDPAVNEQVAQLARAAGALVNRADDPESSDIQFMAKHQQGPITVAVHGGGASASASAAMRDGLAQSLDPDWAVLLTEAKPRRAAVLAAMGPGPARLEKLRRLTDAAAMSILKDSGPAKLRAHLDAIVDSPVPGN